LIVMPTPTVYATLNLFLAVVVGTTLVHGEYGSANSDKEQYVLPQRLVRREFLRFGKRSDPLAESNNDANADTEGREGMDEIYNESDLNMNPNDEEGTHEAREAREARSFLRFGKKSENYLRFGKRVYDDRHGKRSENYLRFGKRFGEISNKKRNEAEEYSHHFDGISAEIQPESWNKKNSEDDIYGCTSFGDGYFVICRLNYKTGNARYKKARDFLRFG